VRDKLWVLTTAAVLLLVPRADAATCALTGFFRDAINLTAAAINPASVASPLNATGCDIGVYYDNTVPGGVATLNKVDVYGARYFGVVVNGDAGPLTAHITNNTIHQIGNVPFDGTQHGVGIYVRAFFSSNVTGEVTGNLVYGYQKGGIVANGVGVKMSKLDNNQVYGIGHVNFIAQNGIQIGYGAMAYPSEIVGNTVTGNSYIGTPGDGSASGGILVVGGPGYGLCPDNNPCPYTKSVLIGINSALNAVIPNTLLNNDVGVFVSNVDTNGVSPPPTPTTVLIIGNVAGDDQRYNAAYQAGISEFGNTDYILANNILQGGGYGSPCSTNIDTTGSLTPQVLLNTPVSCSASAVVAGRKVKVVPEKP
jgi:hypothetical protein